MKKLVSFIVAAMILCLSFTFSVARPLQIETAQASIERPIAKTKSSIPYVAIVILSLLYAITNTAKDIASAIPAST